MKIPPLKFGAKVRQFDKITKYYRKLIFMTIIS